MRRLSKGLVLATALLVLGCAGQPQRSSSGEEKAKPVAAEPPITCPYLISGQIVPSRCPPYVPTAVDMQEDEIRDLRHQVDSLRIDVETQDDDGPPPQWWAGARTPSSSAIHRLVLMVR